MEPVRPSFVKVHVWSHLGRLLGCLGALLGGLVLQRHKSISPISILAFLDCFQEPSWLILGRFGSQHGGQHSLKIGPTSGQFFGQPYKALKGLIRPLRDS